MRTQKPPSPSAAFSLIEAAIVLGIIGLVIGGIWIATSQVRTNMLINKLSTDMIKTAQEIERNSAQFFDTTTLADTMAQMGIIPSEYVYKAANIYVDSTTGYRLSATWSNGGGGTVVQVMPYTAGTYVPKAVCIGIATKLTPILAKSAGSSSNIGIMRTSPSWSPYFFINPNIPDPSTLATACTNGVGYIQFQLSEN